MRYVCGASNRVPLKYSEFHLPLQDHKPDNFLLMRRGHYAQKHKKWGISPQRARACQLSESMRGIPQMMSSSIPHTVRSSKKKMDNDTAESHVIMNSYPNKIQNYPQWDLGCSEIVSVTFPTVC